MKISKSVYGYIILFIFLGGLIITKLAGVWVIYDRDDLDSKHKSSAEVIQYITEYKG